MPAVPMLIIGVWGFSAMSFASACRPVYRKTQKNTFKKITSLQMVYPSCIPSGAVDLIKKLLMIEPKKRMTLTNVMVHPWLAKNYQPDPERN